MKKGQKFLTMKDDIPYCINNGGEQAFDICCPKDFEILGKMYSASMMLIMAIIQRGWSDQTDIGIY